MGGWGGRRGPVGGVSCGGGEEGEGRRTSSRRPSFARGSRPRISLRVEATAPLETPPSISLVTSSDCVVGQLVVVSTPLFFSGLAFSVLTCGRKPMPKLFTSSCSLLQFFSMTGLLRTSEGVGRSMAGRPMKLLR